MTSEGAKVIHTASMWALLLGALKIVMALIVLLVVSPVLNQVIGEAWGITEFDLVITLLVGGIMIWWGLRIRRHHPQTYTYLKYLIILCSITLIIALITQRYLKVAIDAFAIVAFVRARRSINDENLAPSSPEPSDSSKPDLFSPKHSTDSNSGYIESVQTAGIWGISLGLLTTLRAIAVLLVVFSMPSLLFTDGFELVIAVFLLPLIGGVVLVFWGIRLRQPHPKSRSYLTYSIILCSVFLLCEALLLMESAEGATVASQFVVAILLDIGGIVAFVNARRKVNAEANTMTKDDVGASQTPKLHFKERHPRSIIWEYDRPDATVQRSEMEKPEADAQFKAHAPNKYRQPSEEEGDGEGTASPEKQEYLPSESSHPRSAMEREREHRSYSGNPTESVTDQDKITERKAKKSSSLGRRIGIGVGVLLIGLILSAGVAYYFLNNPIGEPRLVITRGIPGPNDTHFGWSRGDLVLEYGSPALMVEDSSEILVRFEGKNKWIGQTHRTHFQLENDRVEWFSQDVDVLEGTSMVYWYRQKKIMTDQLGRPDTLSETGNMWVAYWLTPEYAYGLELHDLEDEYSWDMRRLALVTTRGGK